MSASQTSQPAPVITIDGPASSGKGTISQRIALALGWNYLDSGALYRAATVLAEREGLLTAGSGALEDPERLAARMREASFRCEARAGSDGWARIVLNGDDLSEAVRAEHIAKFAAQLAKSRIVRDALMRLQHAQRRAPGLVAEGRDMGSVVFPDAGVRFFITASPEVRAQRRHKQLSGKGFDVNIATLVRDLQERDHSDRTRAVSPLVPPDGAHVIDTSCLTIEQAETEVLSRCQGVTGH